MMRIFVAVLFAMAICCTRTYSASAQQNNQWTPDARVPDYLDDTFTPILIADQNRTVHAFASQWVGDEDQQLAVVYRQWKPESGWTTPVDVLLSPTGDATVLAVFLDQASVFHVVFWGGWSYAGELYYSQAPASIAWQAPTWSKPQVVGSGPIFPPSGKLLSPASGKLVAIFTSTIEGSGVYEIHSSDGGDTWSKPYPIFLTYNSRVVPFSVDATVDPSGQVHVVWNLVSSTGVDISAHYARLDTAGQEWTVPIVLDQWIDEPGFFGPSFPRIVSVGQDLVVMYITGNPAAEGPVPQGRPVQRMRMSRDGGITWTESISPFPRHLGRSGEYAMVVDSNQVAHALFMQRIETVVNDEDVVIDGPWHSELRGGQWSEPVRFSTSVAPHDMRAVVSQGNGLLVTWREDPGVRQSGVWYSYTPLDAPELPVVPVPTVLPAATATAVPTPSPTAETGVFTVTPSLLAVGSQGAAPTLSDRSPARLLFFAALPVGLVLAAMVIFYRKPFRG